MSDNAALFVLLVLLVIVVLFPIFVSLFQYLWNITMPEVFGLKEITFWQAFRLLLLSAMLFGGCWFHVNK